MSDRPIRTVAIVQARFGSRRLPGKVLRPLAGRPMLAHVLERAAAIPGVDAVCLATSDSPEDTPVARLAESLGFTVFRGALDDVLDRFHGAALDIIGQRNVRGTRASGRHVVERRAEHAGNVGRAIKHGVPLCKRLHQCALVELGQGVLAAR